MRGRAATKYLNLTRLIDLARISPDSVSALTNYLRTFSANELLALGQQYAGANSFDVAEQCFHLAIEKGNANAHFYLGQLYSAVKRVDFAAKHLVLAIDKKVPSAAETLTQLAPLLDGNIFYGIASMFYHGQGISVNRLEARKWYTAAANHGISQAYIDLAQYYIQSGYGERNLERAIFCYKEALKSGQATIFKQYESFLANPPACLTRSESKLIFRESIIYARTHRGSDIINSSVLASGDTSLHLAAKTFRLKDCGRLLLLGAIPSIKNRAGLTAFQELTLPQQQKIYALRDNLSLTLRRLNEPTWEVIAERIIIDNGHLEKKDICRALNELYAIEHIRPILELAKFAALGLHNLAARRSHEVDYDSDDDDVSTVNSLSEKQKLTIHIDAGKECIDYPGYESLQLSGLFTKPNSCFVAGKNKSPSTIRSVLLHELTHFAALECYKNNSFPYSASDHRTRRFFEESLFVLAQQRNIDQVLRFIFHPVYREEEHHRELIARIPEMLVLYHSEFPSGMTRLQQQAPQLLNFYLDTFLPALREHTRFLEERALSHWPKELFAEIKTQTFKL